MEHAVMEHAVMEHAALLALTSAVSGQPEH
jgi:hypothetical protein